MNCVSVILSFMILWVVNPLSGAQQAQRTPVRKQAAAAPAVSAAQAPEERKIADELFNLGKTEDAKAIYLRLESHFTNDFEFMKKLAYCFFVSPKKQMARAVEFYQRAYRMNPKDPTVETNLGKAYVWAGQYKAGAAHFQGMLTRDPSKVEIWLELARAQNQAGEIKAARQTYELYLKRFPGDRDVRLEYATFLSWNKEYDAALQQYRQVSTAEPRNIRARLGEAQVQAWQGKLKESLQAYEDVLRTSPNEYDALRGKAFILLWLQRYDEAGKAFALVVKRKPADRETQEALQQLARARAEEAQQGSRLARDAVRREADLALAENNLPRAIEQFKKLTEMAPGDERLRLQLGQAYAWNQQWTTAIEIFQKLLAERPGNLDALRELGNAQSGAKQLTEAAATYRAYLQRSPDPGVRLSLARVLSWSGNFEEAVTIFQQILQAEPGNSEAALSLGLTLAWQGQHQRALEQFDAVLRQRPGQREALLGKAQVLYWTGSLEKSLAVLETMRETWPQDREVASVLQSVRDAEQRRSAQQVVAQQPAASLEQRLNAAQADLSRSPGDAGVLQRLGDIYQEKQDYTQAISNYEQALAQRPGDNPLRLSLARVSSWNRDFPRSIRHYQELLAQEPGNRGYRLELARILSWSGRNAESIQRYREILKDNPNDLEARLGVARVLSWNKQMDEALKEYDAVIKLNPQSRDALVERAQVYSWKGQLSTALTLYDDVLIRAPEDRDARFGKAQALYWSGRSREAKDILEELQSKNPKDPDVLLTAAGVHAALGRRDMALQDLERLEQLRPKHPEAEQMRKSIRRDLRPVLLLGFTPSIDAFNLKIYSATSALYFSPTPRIRSYVSSSLIPSKDPVNGTEHAKEFIFGSFGRVNEWLLLRGEAGVNSGSTGRQGFIGGAGATFFVTDKLQADLDFSRRFINYIPRPIRLNISRLQVRAALDWRPWRQTTFHLDYYHQAYSDTNRNNGANATVMRKLVRRERFDLEVGYLYAVSGFTKTVDSGFFAPTQFQRHAGLLNFRAKVAAPLAFSFSGSYGREQVFHEPFRRDYTARGAWEYTPTSFFKVSVGYGYFAISSMVRSGAYRTQTAYLTMEIRF